MTDWTAASEAAFINGFEKGYARGVCDRVAEALEGAIQWREGVPDGDRQICLICQAEGEKRYILRPAVYKAVSRSYLVDDFLIDGGYVQTRLRPSEVPFWAEFKHPFSSRWTFTVPEAE